MITHLNEKGEVVITSDSKRVGFSKEGLFSLPSVIVKKFFDKSKKFNDSFNKKSFHKKSFDDGLDENSETAKRARTIINSIKEDIASIKERDPAATSDAEVLLLYPGLHAVMCHRAANRIYNHGQRFVARAIMQYVRNATGIEIHPAATIGNGLFIDHGCGVVIGETAIIGDNCTIYQGVTLGGTGKHTGKRHPTIGNNVLIGAGAKVLGPVCVGNNSKIAAGAVVLTDIPENCTAVGVPARIVRQNNKRVEAFDQVNIPDPINKELAVLRARIEQLEKLNNISAVNVDE